MAQTTQSTQTTWNSTSTSSSRTSQLSALEEDEKRDVLVYRYRCGPGEDPLAIMSKQDLRELLIHDSTLRFSTKPFPRSLSRVDICNEDLYPDLDREKWAHFPSSKTSVASVGLPNKIFMKRLVLNQYPELYIVSPQSSPENTPDNSPESSQHVSPSSTFPRDEVSKEPLEDQ